MYVVSVTVFVKPPVAAEFLEATLDHARHTRQEPGNVRFDVLQSEEDASRFLLYEAYRTKDDFVRHQQTEHYVRWKQTVAALLSGIALAHAGLGAVHGLAAPLGATFPVPHGTICAALLPHVMAANVAALRAIDPRHPVLDRYAAIGRTLAGADELPRYAAIGEGIRQATSLCRDLGIPGLRSFGLGEADVPALVTLAQKSSSMRYNPIALSEGVLQDVLRRAL